jgi:hypothetical protein
MKVDNQLGIIQKSKMIARNSFTIASILTFSAIRRGQKELQNSLLLEKYEA